MNGPRRNWWVEFRGKRNMKIMPRVNVQALMGIEFFADLPMESRQSIAAMCRGRQFRVGEKMAWASARNEEVYFIVSGMLRVAHCAESGKEISLHLLRAGDSFGEASALYGRSRKLDIIAMQSTTVIALSYADFLRILSQHEVVHAAVTRRLARLVDSLAERVIEFGTLRVPGRVRAEIVRLAKRSPVEERAAVVESPLTHAEIATFICSHREAVTREISDLKKRGAIVCSEEGWQIPNIDAIEDGYAVSRPRQ